MKKLVITLLVSSFVPALQAGSSAAYGLGGLAVGTMIGRASAPRDRTVIVQQEAPEPRYGSGRNRIRRLENDVDELRDQLDDQGRKLDKILLAMHQR